MFIRLLEQLNNIENIKINNISLFNEKAPVRMLELEVSEVKYTAGWDYFIKKVSENESQIKGYRNGLTVKFIFPKEYKLFSELIDKFEKELDRKWYLIPEPKHDVITIIAKITNNCNLQCEYCYDMPFRHRLGHNGTLSIARLDKLLDMATKYAKKVVLTFHGGEPTVAGIDYYRRFINEVRPKYTYTNLDIGIQTNGTLLNREWFEMFDEYNRTYEDTFSVSTSFNALDESLRVGDGEKGSGLAGKILENMDLAKEYGYGGGLPAIDVITNENHAKLKDIYQFYKDKGLHCSLNMVDEAGNAKGKGFDFGISKEDDERFIQETEEYFTFWFNEYENEIDERYAFLFTKELLGETTVCEFGSDCVGKWLAINSNGMIYPCDRALNNKYQYGSVDEFNSLEEVFKSPGYKNMRAERDAKYENYCSKCKYYKYCFMNCPMKDLDEHFTASKPNRTACHVLQNTMKGAYRALFNIDIESCNLTLRRYLIKNACVLPGEIPKLLKYLGIADRYADYDYSKENAKMFNKEFELFQTFNPPFGDERLLPMVTLSEKDNGPSEEEKELERQGIYYDIDDRFERIKDALKERYDNLQEERQKQMLQTKNS